MNAWIEHINHSGENFLGFAWPMLWQSSLLIVVVFVLDYLLARSVRAAVRHALWMVVLVKLLLPPALALPTGAAWWLWPAKPPLTPLIHAETVAFDTTPLPQENFVPQTAPIALPPPKLNGLGWAMLASGAISAGLFAWLIMNWLKVARKTHRTRTYAAASGDFADALEQARQLAGLHSPMRLKLVDEAISPAVYGLFRPVILLPRALAEKLSAAQLRAVLLHEAVHLRRGDVWVNCAQTLLQIAYWWHPLLWLANARIRRLREEAVDDAVMLALRGDADAYAPTLLEVAKFAFRRPLASLGLVGILESRSALRQRVERLVDFQAPRRAGVTFLSLFGIFLFGAVTLPMGQAPASESNATMSNTGMSQPQPSTYAPVNTPSSVTPAGVTNRVMPGFKPVGTPMMRTFEVEHYLILGNSLLTPQTINATLTNIDGAFGTNVSYEGVKTVQEQLQQAYYERGYAAVKVTLPMQKITNATVKIQVLEGRTSPGLPNEIIIDAPVLQAQLDRTNAMEISPGRKEIYRKLKGIHLEAVSYQDLPLSEVIRKLHEESLLRDRDKTGINFLFKPNPDDATQIDITLKVKNVSLLDLLDAICMVADHPIKYSVEDDGVVFSPKDPAAAQYEMRTFKVDPNIFYSQWKENLNSYISNNVPGPDYPVRYLTDDVPGLHYSSPPQQIQKLDLNFVAKQFFQKLGVNFDPPKTIFFNDRLGVLFVYATPHDLDVIERRIQEMNVGAANPSDPRQQAAALAKDGQLLYEMGRLDEAEQKLKEALALDPDNQRALYYLNLIAQAKVVSQTGQGSARAEHAPYILAAPANIVINPTNLWDPQQNDENHYSRQWANDGSLAAAPVLNQPKGGSAHATQVPFLLSKPRPNAGAFSDGVFDPYAFRPSYQRVSSVNPADLITNNFQINVAAFRVAVLKETGESDALQGFREIALKARVDLSPPKQVQIRSERFGDFYVVATRKDMGPIMGILDRLHLMPQQIHIKARFIEVPKTFFDDERGSILSSVTNGGILTHAQFLKFLHQLQSMNGPQELAEPEGTTLVGRQMQMRATVIEPIITNWIVGASPGEPTFTYPQWTQVDKPANKPPPGTIYVSGETANVETGPILDTLATVLPDGYTIDLIAIPSLIKFFGYADTRGLPPHFGTNSDGQIIKVPIALPAFGIAETRTEKWLYDGQTLVLLPTSEYEYCGYLDGESGKRIKQLIQQATQKNDGNTLGIVLVTATLIDPAGNPIHSKADMPFAQNSVPRQPIIWSDVSPGGPNSSVRALGATSGGVP